jgi:hypothetical protein
MAITLEKISNNSGAYPSGLSFESEAQLDGSERPVVKLGSVTSTNVHTGNEELRVFAAGHVCTQNSTNVPLAGNAVFTGGWQDTLDYSEVIVSVVANVASATDGLVVEWSSAGVTADENDVFTAPAANGKTWSFPCNRRFVRIIYTNGSAAQTTFNMQTLLKRYASKGSSHRLADSLNAQDDAIVTKTLVAGKTTAGGGAIVDVKVNPSGALTVDATVTSNTDGTQKTQITDPDGDVAQVIAGANTGVKGLRVYGGPTDPISDIPVVIQYDHHQVHEGESHEYCYLAASVGLNANLDYRLNVPDGLTPTIRTPHLIMEVVTTAEAEVYLFEDMTFTVGNGGTLQTSYNRNRNSATTPGMTIYLTPTPATTGTNIWIGLTGSGKSVGSGDRANLEWDLKPNANYLFRVTSRAAGNKILVRLLWYEDLGV